MDEKRKIADNQQHENENTAENSSAEQNQKPRTERAPTTQSEMDKAATEQQRKETLTERD